MKDQFKLRFRNFFIVAWVVGTVLAWILSDPDLGLLSALPFGAGLLSKVIYLSSAILGVVLLYFVRKGMFDYPSADFESLGKKASLTPEGAGLYAISISIMCVAFAMIITSALG